MAKAAASKGDMASTMAEFYKAQLAQLMSSVSSSGILESDDELQRLQEAQATIESLMSGKSPGKRKPKGPSVSTFKGGEQANTALCESASTPTGVSSAERMGITTGEDTEAEAEIKDNALLPLPTSKSEVATDDTRRKKSNIKERKEGGSLVNVSDKKVVPTSDGPITETLSTTEGRSKKKYTRTETENHLSIRFKRLSTSVVTTKAMKQMLCQEKIPVIPMDSPYRLGWDLFMTLLILYYAFFVPYRLGFSVCPAYPGLEHFFTSCFGLDIILNLNTSVKVNGEQVWDRRGIAYDYCCRASPILAPWMIIDLVATVPLDLIMAGGEVACVEGGSGKGAGDVGKMGRLAKLFRLLRIFKLLRLLKLGRIFARFKNAVQLNPTIILLMKTVAMMLMMLHLAACGYMGFVLNQEKHLCPDVINVGNMPSALPGDVMMDGMLLAPDTGCTSRTYNINEEWIPPDHVLLGTVGHQYSYAFFWAISACTGIGWDIIPGNSYEIAYSSVMILTGMFTYITILSSVSAIFSQLNLKNQKRIAKMDSIYAYLKSAHVTKDLKRDISAFYDFMWMDSLGSEDGSAFIKDLPKSLQVRLVTEIHTELLDKLSIFKDMTPAATFHLVNVWKKVIFMPTDVIIAEGTTSSTLYIIVRGKVKLTIQSGFFRVTMMELEEGAFFGESGILADSAVKQMASVRAIGYCELLTISKHTYDEMRTLFPMSNMAHEDLKKAMKSRKARAMWKQAFMKVKAVNRLMRAATANRPENLAKDAAKKKGRRNSFSSMKTWSQKRMALSQ